MSTISAERARDGYALGHSPEEYERLRKQARDWEAATERLLDGIPLASHARCLDAACGPGETMRLMERRVGSAALVVGIDADAALGELALASLHAAGHRRCRFIARDLTEDGPIPGRPYDLVYTRLLLSHLPARVAVLERLWDAVAPGGHLLVQDYDLRTASVLPELDSAAEVKRVLVSTFIAAGCDVHAGAHLAQLFEAAGLGEPDGTDVAGRIEPLATGSAYLESSFRSVLPAAIAHGVTTAAEADATLAALADDAARHPEAALLWPLMIGAWKRKEG